jgi:hypothetical protein
MIASNCSKKEELVSCRRAENILIAFYCLTASSQQCSGRGGGSYKNLVGTNNYKRYLKSSL